MKNVSNVFTSLPVLLPSRHPNNVLTTEISPKKLFFVEQKETAIRLYKEGILELERGINIDVWQGHGEKWLKAQRLHDKMQTNLAMAKDRLHFLGEQMDKRLVSGRNKLSFLINRSNLQNYFNAEI